jgi:hypothetical protein
MRRRCDAFTVWWLALGAAVAEFRHAQEKLQRICARRHNAEFYGFVRTEENLNYTF